MKTIFNDNVLRKVLAILLLIVFAAALLSFIMKSKQKTAPLANEDTDPGELIVVEEKEIAKKPTYSELTIDRTEDAKSLGYTGQRKLAHDKKDNLYVAYRKKYLGKYEIFVARVSGKNNPIVSGITMPIANIKAANQRVPSVAVDSRGIIHTVWYGSDTFGQENNRQIKYASSDDQGQTWADWKNISPVMGYYAGELYWQEHPSLLIGPDDALYVVWEGKDDQNKNQQIKFSKSEDGGINWSSWKNISTSKSSQSRPSLVMDRKGNLHLFMYSSEGNSSGDGQQIQYANSTDQGDNWSDWQVISDPLLDSRHASVTIDSHDVIHLAWRAGIDESQPSQIFYSALSGGEWGNILPVPASSRFQFFPSIGIDQTGSIYVVWMENDGPSDFPREDPGPGSSVISLMKAGVFQDSATLNDHNKLYPNIPENINAKIFMPLVYLEQSGTGYQIKLKSLGVSK